MSYGPALMAVASLGLISASPSRQLPSIAQAADTAFLMGCNLHVIGASSIDEKNKSALEKSGIIVTADDVPEDLKAASVKEWGTPVFAKVESTSGLVWISAYPDSTACSITSTSGEAAKIYDEIQKSIEADKSFWVLANITSSISANILSRKYRLNLNNGLKGALVMTATVSPALGDSNKFALIAFRDN